MAAESCDVELKSVVYEASCNSWIMTAVLLKRSMLSYNMS